MTRERNAIGVEGVGRNAAGEVGEKRPGKQSLFDVALTGARSVLPRLARGFGERHWTHLRERPVVGITSAMRERINRAEAVIDPPARGSKSPSHHQSLARLRRARATSRDREDRNAGFDRRRRSRANDARATGDRGREDGRGRHRRRRIGQRRVERGTRDAGRGRWLTRRCGRWMRKRTMWMNSRGR